MASWVMGPRALFGHMDRVNHAGADLGIPLFQTVSQRLTGVDAADIDTSLEMLGTALRHPIMAAPMGLHGLVHSEGEVATAPRGRSRQRALPALGRLGRTLEDIAAATTGPKWFQVYVNNDPGGTRSILERAADAGFTAIILTTDAVGPGGSDRVRRLGQPMPSHRTFANHDPAFGGTGDFADQKAGLTLEDIAFCREVTGLPVMVKGILRPEDAVRSIDAGAAAAQVSNHGGHQIDALVASIDALPAIAEAEDGRVPIIMDGSIRRGRAVFQALALGADAVAVGRPMLYGLGFGGSEGVRLIRSSGNFDRFIVRSSHSVGLRPQMEEKAGAQQFAQADAALEVRPPARPRVEQEGIRPEALVFSPRDPGIGCRNEPGLLWEGCPGVRSFATRAGQLSWDEKKGNGRLYANHESQIYPCFQCKLVIKFYDTLKL